MRAFVLPVTFLFNIDNGMSGIGSLVTVLIVVSVLALTNLAIGYPLRSRKAVADREVLEESGEQTAM